jgi:hypothetical protein
MLAALPGDVTLWSMEVLAKRLVQMGLGDCAEVVIEAACDGKQIMAFSGEELEDELLFTEEQCTIWYKEVEHRNAIMWEERAAAGLAADQLDAERRAQEELDWENSD